MRVEILHWWKLVSWMKKMHPHSKLLGMMTEEDVAMAADTLPENTYAAMALFEHRWAIGLHKALYATGGFMLDSAYINPQTQSEVILEITEMEVDDVR
jgi:hypothetical protein